MKTILTILFLSSLCFSQSKDSTHLDFWITELHKTESYLANLDTLKIEAIGVWKYQYNQAITEKKKLEKKK